MKRVAVCPGSYDPVTVGHADVIRRAAKLFGACEVVVMNNDQKEYRFSLDERYELCRAAFAGNPAITVTKSSGMLFEYLAGREGDAVLVKGVRNAADYEYEKKMAAFNFAHCGVETLYLDASPDLVRISSTAVRELLSKNGAWEDLVPKETVELLKNKL